MIASKGSYQERLKKLEEELILVSSDPTGTDAMSSLEPSLEKSFKSALNELRTHFESSRFNSPTFIRVYDKFEQHIHHRRGLGLKHCEFIQPRWLQNEQEAPWVIQISVGLLFINEISARAIADDEGQYKTFYQELLRYLNEQEAHGLGLMMTNILIDFAFKKLHKLERSAALVELTQHWQETLEHNHELEELDMAIQKFDTAGHSVRADTIVSILATTEGIWQRSQGFSSVFQSCWAKRLTISIKQLDDKVKGPIQS